MPLLVIGIAAEDRILALDRLPQAGESVLARGMQGDLGGKGANQAVAAARAGARVRLVAAVGADAAGEAIAARLEREGVETRFLLRRPGPTPLSLVFVLPGGENAVVGVAQEEGLAPEVLAPALAGLGPGDRLLVSGHLDRDGLAFALARARDRGMATAVNLAPVPFTYRDLWPQIDLVIANAGELALHTGESDPQAAVRFLHAAGVREVLVTLGAGGALLADPGDTIRVPAPEVEAVDTTGAGDLLAGTFTGLLERGIDRETALRVAVEAASAKTARPGTLSAFPDRAEIGALLATAAASRR